jgi:anhydro-N-acetylmuramic acid kinase
MSGTSLDGLDVAACEFWQNQGWHFNILYSDCYLYSQNWRELLSNAHELNSNHLSELNVQFGEYIAGKVNKFISEKNISGKIDFIASHGHTVFHQPEKSFTLQIGDGQRIANLTNIPVISDFRTQDVKFNGQGAPLVPIGDRLLFSEYNQCLNLGGFSNISMEKNGKRVAWDICPVNIVLNALSLKLGKSFDENGTFGKSGLVNADLLFELEQLDYYKQSPPKSLGREWVQKNINPLLNKYNIPIQDKFRTVYEHVALRIASHLDGKVLVTGGGTKNEFLMNLLSEKSNAEITIPSADILDYKEALIFAFLATLRWRNEINILASVTGADKDHSSGRITLPK